MNAFYLLLAAAILAGYAVALWRLLRSESALSLWTVAVLSAVALLLRLVAWSRYPGGLNGDEPLILLQAVAGMKRGDLFGEGTSGLPELIPILFEAPLVPLVGGGRWAIRLYSTITSVLSVAATFGVARAMRMRPISSLTAAAFVVFLPWSILYGRISQGGELLFNQLLLLAALARLIWRDGNWREIPAGALGLCLLFYDYFSGRSMLAMPVVSAVLARGRNRLWCLLIPLVALAGFIPQTLRGHRYALVGLTLLQVHEGYTARPLETLWLKLLGTLSALAYPVAANGWMTVTHGAVHPWLVLALAVLGLLTGFRRALFLTAGFVVGLMPGLVAHGDLTASAHRIHAAYVFIALAAGASFDLIPWRSARTTLAAIAVTIAGFQSITLYFSNQFWNNEARWMFDTEATDLVESIPTNEPRIVESGLGYHIAIRDDLRPRVEKFGADHLFVDGPALYVFAPELWPLRPFYESLFPPSAVQTFDRAFSLRIGQWDNSWLRTHGWSYRVRCGDIARQEQVLTLFQMGYTFANYQCPRLVEHMWKARWLGPPSALRLWFGENDATVTTSSGGEMTPADGPLSLDFEVQSGEEITVRIFGRTNVIATLYVVMPQGERLPYWEWVQPVALP